ncbi:MAG: DNA polymerase, partial [Patescibacteria group bacterium]
DDVLGKLVEEVKNQKPAVKSIVVTGDMDMLQLVDDEIVEVYLLRKGLSDFVLFDERKIKEHFGFGSERIVDYKSLRGDTSDNIPGVKGIGEKTAKELIEKIGGVSEIYGNIEKLSGVGIKDAMIKKLIDGETSARMSQKLATIDRAVPGLEFKLENCATPLLDKEKLLPLFQKFEFTSLLKRINPGVNDNRKEIKPKTQKSLKLKVVETENFEEFYDKLNVAPRFACKEILNGTDPLENNAVGLVYVVVGVSYFADWSKLTAKDKTKLLEIFKEKNKILVGHDLKSLVKWLILNNVSVGNELFDTMMASYMLNSSTRAHDIAAIALRELGEEINGGSAQSSLFGVDPNAVAEGLAATAVVEKTYRERLKERSDSGLFQKVEMELIPVLAEMELNGVFVDSAELAEMSRYAAETVKKLTEKIWAEAGEEFNIASSTQLRDILYEKLGLRLPGIKKGKTGYSTAASELEKLRGVHPIIEFIEEYREVSKLQNTYIDVLPTLINKSTGRIHTTFNQAVTTTGRLSSSDPNLQNIPIRSELGRKIRDAFVAEPGNVLIAADYSQIELRIVASLAEDEKLIEIFSEGRDV